MPTGNRADIAKFVIDRIRSIDGGVSPLDSNYTYSTNLSETTYRGVGFLPSTVNTLEAHVNLTTEDRDYQHPGRVESYLACNIRLYSYSKDPVTVILNAVQDIEHVLYNSVKYFSSNGIHDILPDRVKYTELEEADRWSADIYLDLVYELDHSR